MQVKRNQGPFYLYHKMISRQKSIKPDADIHFIMMKAQSIHREVVAIRNLLWAKSQRTEILG